MTIRALKEKLSKYDNDMEITFEVDGVFEPTSITITKQYCEAHIHNGLRVEGITKRDNNCLLVLARAEKGYLPTLDEVLEQEPKIVLYSGNGCAGGKDTDVPTKNEPKTDGDAISRQEVLKLFATHDGKYLYEAIRDMPSVRPKTKTGRWIMARTFPTKLYDEYLNEYECSECQRRIRCTENQLVNYPYCHCGAKTEG